MTGFGRAERSADGVTVALQISSVNRKNLEIVCSLPKELQFLERKVTDVARNRVSRGRLQFSVEIRNEEGGVAGLPSDESLAAAVGYLKRNAEKHSVLFELNTQALVDLASMIEAEAGSLPEETVEALLLETTSEAMNQLIAMREQEGTALKSDLSERVVRLKKLVGELGIVAPDMVAKHRENLLVRLEQANLELAADDERVLKEISIFADRCDISEELTRLDSHFEQFGQMLEKEGAIGRSIEFLVQEIGREINTSGSKSCSIEASKLVLGMKNELERIREQIANVE